MTQFQQIITLLLGSISLFIFIRSFNEIKNKNNAFGVTPEFFILGIFVWGDAIVLAPFWFGASIISLYLNNWYLLLLIFTVYWTIRSLGETIYWFNQQFSNIQRNPPERLRGYSLFKNDSIWFAYQTLMQCVSVASIVLTVYLIRIIF